MVKILQCHPIRADDTDTAKNIETALDALKQNAGFKSYLPILNKKFDVKVTVAAPKKFNVAFHAPGAKDVLQMEVVKSDGKTAFANTSGTPIDFVSKIQEGRTESGLINIETLKAANADNTFIFGDGWGGGYKLELDSILPWKVRDSSLTIDTSLVTQNHHSLILDFSGVSKELKFDFSTNKFARMELDFSGLESTTSTSFDYVSNEINIIDLKGEKAELLNSFYRIGWVTQLQLLILNLLVILV